MRYNPHVQQLETEGFGETRHYSIAATGKAFRNLMDGLYSRKVEAVVRELSTNALDSHIDAGHPDRQFRIMLPNELRPQFSVRDYGVGMPHTQVMELYSTLFESTKDKDNTKNGMLGLGSKSPFAYTDGFTLRCYDGETRRTYASYLDDGGVPMISVADVSASTEPRGVEVSFPVKKEDCRQFVDAAARVYVGFPYPPLGITDGVRQKIKVVEDRSGAGWVMLKEAVLPRADAWALQGCVLYPVELRQIDEDSELIGHLQRGSGQLVLDFEMGSLEFTPGRETLSYTDGTKAAIRARWDQFRSDLDAVFAEDFKDCDSDWKIAVKAHQKNMLGLYSGFFRFSSKHKSTQLIDANINQLLPRDSSSVRYSNAEYHFSIVNNDGSCFRFKQRARGRYPSKCISNGKPLVWVERSKGVSAPNRRISLHLQKLDSRYAVVWDQPEPGEKGPDLAKFGNPPVLRTADLPLPPRAPSVQSDYQRYMTLNVKGMILQMSHAVLEDLPRSREHVFIHDGRLIKATAGLPARDWPTLMPRDRFDNMMRLRTPSQPEVVVVRLRANEVYDKWRKLPLLRDTSATIVAKLSRAEVVYLTNCRNKQRFEQSRYQYAYERFQNSLTEEQRSVRNGKYVKGAETFPRPRTMPADNPILQLSRFSQRLRGVRIKGQSRLQNMLGAFSIDMHERLTDRALAMGLEVLPEPCPNSGMPYPLLPLRWENVARMVGQRHGAEYSLGLLVRHLAQGEK